MAAGEPRFGMLETIREYALERLAERGDGQAVRRRHAGFYLPLAEEAEPALLGPQQLSWLERLDAERDNLRAALTWATEEGEAEVGLRIGAALWRFWQLRGSDSEGRERLERLLALPLRLGRGAGAGSGAGRVACVRAGRSRGGASLSARRACRSFAGWETTGSSRATLGVIGHLRPGDG